MPYWVIDSGTTKADYALVDDAGVILQQFTTAGINPYVMDDGSIASIFKEHVSSVAKGAAATQMFFYAAGASTVTNKIRLEQLLSQHFSVEHVIVEHDLLGAARAALGREAGIAGILGTGSNSCFYDGEHIVDNVRSLGYILGDDGGGVNLGKLLMRAYAYRKLPSHLAEELEVEHNLNVDSLLNKVYLEKGGNTYLASFTTFIKKHEEEQVIYDLILRNFNAYFEGHVAAYPEGDLAFIGSVALHFEKQLKEVASAHSRQIRAILQKPLHALVAYHHDAENN